MTKKIISLAIAVLMIVNVFAFTSGAAIADGKVFSLELKSENTTVKPGDYVKVVFNYEGADGFRSIGGGEFDVAYDTAIFSTVVAPAVGEKALFTATDANGVAVVETTGYAYDGKINTTYSNIQNVTDQHPEIASDKTVVRVGVAQNSGSWAAVDGTNGADFLAVNFKVAADATPGTYRIALYTDAFTNMDKVYGYINVEGLDSCYEGCMSTAYGYDSDEALAYDFSEAYVDITVAEETADPIVWKQNQVRPAEDGIANAIDIGVKAEFTKEAVPITFDAKGTSENFAAVGAELQLNGAPYGYGESAFVYEVSEGVFQYRVILKNIAKNSEDVYTLRFYAIDTNGNYTYGETVDVSIADCDLTKLPA